MLQVSIYRLLISPEVSNNLLAGLVDLGNLINCERSKHIAVYGAIYKMYGKIS